jgi:hypothetical protein
VQRYQCKSCLKRFIGGALQRGGQKLGSHPMTNRENQKRWYDSLSADEKITYMAKKAEYRRELRARKKAGTVVLDVDRTHHDRNDC